MKKIGMVNMLLIAMMTKYKACVTDDGNKILMLQSALANSHWTVLNAIIPIKLGKYKQRVQPAIAKI